MRTYWPAWMTRPLLAGGLDASQLISELADAHLQLTTMILTRSPR